jgi:hypothetical protein
VRAALLLASASTRGSWRQLVTSSTTREFRHRIHVSTFLFRYQIQDRFRRVSRRLVFFPKSSFKLLPAIFNGEYIRIYHGDEAGFCPGESFPSLSYL